MDHGGINTYSDRGVLVLGMLSSQVPTLMCDREEKEKASNLVT